MAERNRKAMMGRLIEVERARRFAAEAALAEARAAEQSAAEAEADAVGKSEAAQLQWREYVAKPGFAPEYVRALSAIVAEREREAESAALSARLATDVRARRQSDWQGLEARVRLSEEAHRRLTRKARRDIEECRLGELADRTSYAWGRS